jgi:hypothetical protein
LNWSWDQKTSSDDPSFIDGITGEPTIQAGQLNLDVDWTDTHGSPSPTQFAKNSSAIVLAIFDMSATPNVTVTYINGVLPYAQGNPNQAGLVALTDTTGLAVGTTDARVHDPRVPAPLSVETGSVAQLIQTGLQASSYPTWVAGLAAPGAKVVDSNGNLQICSTTQTGPQLISPYLPAHIPATAVTDLIAVTAGPTYTLGGWNTNVGGVTWQAISNSPPTSSVEWIWTNAGPANLPAYDPAAFVTFSLSSVSVAGSVVTYNGAITGTIGSESVSGAGDFFVGYRFTVAGFTNVGNNGVELLCTSSSATTLILTNPYAVDEVTGATATLNQGGISSDVLIYKTKKETITAALDALFAASGGSAGVVSFNGRFGVVTAQAGDYTASQVGAAPASHVGQQLGLGTSHPASVTSDTGGFTVNEATTSVSGDAAVLLSNTNVRKAALTHSGDLYSLLANAANAQGLNGTGGPATYRGTLGLMSLIANVLAEHVNYNSHGNNNPHGLSAADIGAASETYVNTTVSGIISDVTAYTDAKTNISVRVVTTPGPSFPGDSINPGGGTITGQPGLPHNPTGQADVAYPSTSASITYVIINFGGFFEIAFGHGVYAGTQQVALPEATGWSSTNFYASASLSFAMNITYDTKGNYYEAVVNNSTRIVKVIGTADESHQYVFNGIAAVSAVAWRNLTANALIISAFDTTTQTFNQGSVGNTVQIQGRNFGSSGTFAFNGHAAAISGYSSTSITCTIPAGATTGVLTVTPTGGTPVNSPFVFTIV